MKPETRDPELARFFARGNAWADDSIDQAARSRRVAWIIAAVATTVAALEAIALAGLAPLKTVVPHTVLVDRQTGFVTTIDPSTPSQLTADQALTRSMLAQYVAARETLDRGSVRADYRKVALWSGSSARESYLAAMRGGSPSNPFAAMPAGAAMRAEVKSVSPVDAGSALVRFDVVAMSPQGGAGTPQPYVSLVRYRYRDRLFAESDRFLNPLGFEVTGYRRDPEAVASAASAAPSSSTPAAIDGRPVTMLENRP